MQMISRYQYQNIHWIDLFSPTKKEIREVIEEYNIHSSLGDALIEPARHPLVELHEESIYLVLHFPAFRRGKGNERVEIDFVIGKDFIVTLHYEPVDPLQKFAKNLETNAILRKENGNSHTGLLFFSMIRNLYYGLSTELDGIEDRLEEAEMRVFQGGEKQMVEVLSEINKDLLDFKQAIRPHKEVLESFEIAGENFFGQDFSNHLRAITREYEKLSRTVEAHKETLAELRQTNDSLLSAKATNVMKTLTIITFATYPSIFLTGLFSVNSQNAPVMGHPHDFWIILLLILLATTSIFGFFVYKRWF